MSTNVRLTNGSNTTLATFEQCTEGSWYVIAGDAAAISHLIGAVVVCGVDSEKRTKALTVVHFRGNARIRNGEIINADDFPGVACYRLIPTVDVSLSF